MEPDPGRDALVERLRPHVADERVLEAIGSVRRELYVPAELRERAYDNEPLPIGDGQTISQPLAVAHMCELLAVGPGDRVLDVGTGSGYHAAVLAAMGGRVWTVELREGVFRGPLPPGVTAALGDGTAGLPGAAPFDAINVAAAGRESQLATLHGQLADGGRLVAPIGTRRQTLVRWVRDGADVVRTDHGQVRFVRLVEDVGWA